MKRMLSRAPVECVVRLLPRDNLNLPNMKYFALFYHKYMKGAQIGKENKPMRKETHFITRTLLSLAVILWLYAPSKFMAQSPQETATPQTTQASATDCGTIRKNLGLSDNFTEVADLRDTINAESARLDQKIRELSQQILKAPTEAQLEDRRKERERIAAKPKKTNEDEFRLAELDDTDVRSRESLKQELSATEQALASKKAQARCIQQTINSLYSPEQVFKRTMSVIFAGLIGLVILGFFVLSYKDESIRRAIFSGQTGIQFLTLFSIVIAIILFGITSILQDKELAALLGGLSGYILGRYSSSAQSKPTSEGAPALNAPAGNNP